ncbi:unnamed protein product [Adineta steineri]|uniref:IRG-type G domain-containing protein n=2 Tax=Adineta steineri TaxID=433720 RepID=A0A819E8M3_9BILA|nr:unnamed protein product [Adineta steineri]CAF0937861.1 unnamed protein product [Adineta steineri]CAF1035970.1 unnamed protein product [Adineta steineri]CAF1042201.1 unnamed protein product [Adineta steineri]CAF3845894.1 unnamed protein product [Adineta steineri]
MNFSDFEQFFYREPFVETITTGGNFQFITDEEIRATEQFIHKNGVNGLDTYLSQRLDAWRQHPLDIAVVGSSGVGKSTFINCFRGLDAEDEGAAAVGVVETTNEPKPYEHPEFSNLKIWDLPGVGTPNYPRSCYLEKIQFQRYDFFLILCRTRFTENDLWLASEVKQNNKRFVFIRTNIDSDLFNEYEDHPSTYNEENILERIRNNSLEYIRSVDPNAEVFLISGHLKNRLRFDFGKLNETLLRNYPSLKRESMILSMSVMCKEVLVAKVATLYRRIWLIASASAAVAVIPVPFLSLGFDATLVMNEVEFYKKQLGLDQAALLKLSQVYRIPMDKIEKELNEVFPIQYLNSLRSFVFDFAKKQAIGTTTGQFARYVPYVGTAIVSTLSFGVCYVVLYKILIRMQQASLKIIDVIMNASDQMIQEQQQQRQALI